MFGELDILPVHFEVLLFVHLTQQVLHFEVEGLPRFLFEPLINDRKVFGFDEGEFSIVLLSAQHHVVVIHPGLFVQSRLVLQ